MRYIAFAIANGKLLARFTLAFEIVQHITVMHVYSSSRFQAAIQFNNSSSSRHTAERILCFAMIIWIAFGVVVLFGYTLLCSLKRSSIVSFVCVSMCVCVCFFWCKDRYVANCKPFTNNDY